MPNNRGELEAAPVIQVDGKANYETKMYYLDKVIQFFGPDSKVK